MGLFNVRKVEEEQLTKAIEKTENSLAHLRELQAWINRNNGIVFMPIHALKNELNLAKYNKKGRYLAFESGIDRLQREFHEELQFSHELVHVLHEKIQETKRLTQQLKRQEYDFQYTIREMNERIQRAETIEKLKERQNSQIVTKALNAQTHRKTRTKQTISEQTEQYYVPKEQLIQTLPKEIRHSKQDVYNYYIKHSYPSLVFLTSDQQKEAFTEIKKTLQPYLLAECHFTSTPASSWSANETYVVLVVEETIRQDVYDAVKVYRSVLKSIKVKPAFINEQGYYPFTQLEEKREQHSVKTKDKEQDKKEKIQRKKEQFLLLVSNMKQGKFHTHPECQQPFSNKEAQFLVERGYSIYTVAKLFGLPLERLQIEQLNEQNQKEWQQAMDRQALDIFLELALDLYENELEHHIRGICDKMNQKYTLGIC